MIYYEIISVILGLAGLYVANKIRVEKKAGHKMVCPLNGNCEEVLRSDFAKFAGVPLEIAGIFYYLFIIAGALLMFFVPSLSLSMLTLMIFAATFFGFLFSFYLTFIQAFLLKNWCTWCLYSALVSTLIFISSLSYFLSNLKNIIELMTSIPNFFIMTNIIAYALGTSLSIVIGFVTFRFLRDFKIDQREKMILMYLWQMMWSTIFLIIISTFAVLIFDLKVYDTEKLFAIKSAIFVFVIAGSALMSFWILPKLDKSKISCSVMHVLSISFYRNMAIALSAFLMASWVMNLFVGKIFFCLCSDKKNLVIYFSILAIISFATLVAFQIMDKKTLDKKK